MTFNNGLIGVIEISELKRLKVWVDLIVLST